MSLREEAEEVKSWNYGRKVMDLEHHWHVGAALVPMARWHVTVNPPSAEGSVPVWFAKRQVQMCGLV